MRLSTAESLAFGLAILNSTTMASELYRSSHMPKMAEVPIAPFGYDALSGPLNWYALNRSGNALCDTGKNQSPLDIVQQHLSEKVTIEEGSILKMNIPNVSKATIENVGATINTVVNGTLMDGNKAYSLVQYHWHAPSEHRINSMPYEMEEHFLFEAKDASLAVVTFLNEISEDGSSDAHTKASIANFEKAPVPGDISTTGPINFEAILDHLHSNELYRYVGSLTSPPCQEDVLWLISAKPVPVNAASYNIAKRIQKFNSRGYVQAPSGQMNLIEKAASDLQSVVAPQEQSHDNFGSMNIVSPSVWWLAAWFVGLLHSIALF